MQTCNHIDPRAMYGCSACAGVVIKGDVTLEAASSTPVLLEAGEYSSGTVKVGEPALVPA